MEQRRNYMVITVEARSLQLALLKAAGQLGITQSDLGYKVVKEHSGLWGLFGKKVSVEAWVINRNRERNNSRRSNDSRGRERTGREDRPHRDEQRAPRREARSSLHSLPRGERGERLRAAEKENEEETKTPQRPPLTQEEIAALKIDLKAFCSGLIQQITGEACDVDISEEDDRLVFAVSTSAIAEALSKNMKFVEAIEHLIRKKPKDLHQEMPFRIYVDINGVRQARQDELTVMARDLSDKVFESKRPIVLNYRSSYDRKIIHMALDKDNRVYTKSIGNGPNRKLMILPVRQQGQEVGAR
jgi:spoIIIJ-associated protein